MIFGTPNSLIKPYESTPLSLVSVIEEDRAFRFDPDFGRVLGSCESGWRWGESVIGGESE